MAKKTKKATEEKGETVGIVELNEEAEKEAKEMTAEDFENLRQSRRDECSAEINVILKKYGCDLTARVIVGERGNIPQVFLIDERS